jgi:hypothetical protein
MAEFFFYLEDGGGRFLQNTHTYVPNYTASNCRKSNFTRDWYCIATGFPYHRLMAVYTICRNLKCNITTWETVVENFMLCEFVICTFWFLGLVTLSITPAAGKLLDCTATVAAQREIPWPSHVAEIGRGADIPISWKLSCLETPASRRPWPENGPRRHERK